MNSGQQPKPRGSNKRVVISKPGIKGSRKKRQWKVSDRKGLDLLESQTSLALSTQGKPLGKGTVNQQLTTLTAADSSGLFTHKELPIPTSHNEPYGLQLLLYIYEKQFMAALEMMNTPEFEVNVKKRIKSEKEKSERLKLQISEVREEINRAALIGVNFFEQKFKIYSPRNRTNNAVLTEIKEKYQCELLQGLGHS